MGKKNIVWNDYISQKDRFADFINGVVFQGEQIVLPENLHNLDSKLWRRNYSKNSYHEYIRDAVKVWEYKGKSYVFNLEPEASPHHALPVKYMNYESLEYDRQYKSIVKKHREEKDLSSDEYLSGFADSDRLMPVVTIGIYLGEKPWTGLYYLSEMTGKEEIPSEIRGRMEPFFNGFHSNLVNIHEIETIHVFRTDLQVVFGFLKYQSDKEKLKKYVETNEVFRYMKEDAFDVLSAYSESWELSVRKEECQTEEGLDMCTALREWAEEERAAGREEGMTLGKAEGKAVINELIYCLLREGRVEELSRACRDMKYQDELLLEYGINNA